MFNLDKTWSRNEYVRKQRQDYPMDSVYFPLCPERRLFSHSCD